MDDVEIVWTDYMLYRANLRGFELATVEQIVRYSNERYVDTATGRLIAVGRHDRRLVMIAYELGENIIRPVTIHATSRRQVNFRVKSGRFRNE